MTADHDQLRATAKELIGRYLPKYLSPEEQLEHLRSDWVPERWGVHFELGDVVYQLSAEFLPGCQGLAVVRIAKAIPFGEKSLGVGVQDDGASVKRYKHWSIDAERTRPLSQEFLDELFEASRCEGPGLVPYAEMLEEMTRVLNARPEGF